MSANVKQVFDGVKPFDGSGDITTWLKRFDLMIQLLKVKDVTVVIPLLLEVKPLLYMSSSN